MATVAATKRPRAPSSPSLRSSTAGSADPPSKASRIADISHAISTTSTSSTSDTTVKQEGSVASVSARPLFCNLPPTCQRHPTPIANTNELERHYATYHAHVCEDKGCGCVFPDARLLELHQTECHDPIAALNKERGQKIFQCHIAAPTCGRHFMTPKARRLHLIQAHAFPKEYFFAVTNKGIGGLLKKWGEGASMVRKEWKPRENPNAGLEHTDGKSFRGQTDDKMDEDEMDEEDEEDDDDDDDEEDADEEGANQGDDQEEAGDPEATPRMLPRTTGIHSPQSSISSSSKGHAQHIAPDRGSVDGLVNSFDSLSLVPSSIRFGRGAKTGGFAPDARGTRARGRSRGAVYSIGRGGSAGKMDVDGSRTGPPNAGGRERVSTSADRRDTAPHLQDGVPRSKVRGRGRPRGRGRGRGL